LQSLLAGLSLVAPKQSVLGDHHANSAIHPI
jgi:hypothetical protein